MSSWRSTSSPTTEAAVCGNGRSWRTCGTSIPRRWAGDRSGKISVYSFFSTGLSRREIFFFNQEGEVSFLGFSFSIDRREGVLLLL